MSDLDQMITRVRIWWTNQWLHPDKLYRVRELSQAEQHKTRELVKRIPRTGFTCHPSLVPDQPDTWIVCEALATKGQMLVTHNLGTIRRGVINNWVAKHAADFGLRNSRLILSSDEWLKEQLGGLESDASRERAAKLALAAFWPQDPHADPSIIIAGVAERCCRMRFSPYSECMSEAEGALIEGSRTRSGPAFEWAEEVRSHLPERMRTAEYAHPRYPSGGFER